MPQPVTGGLSNTFRSDRTFTPLAPNRSTASKFLYSQTTPSVKRSGEKWGRDFDYGLAISDVQNQTIKGHKHFSCGFEQLPSDVAQYQVYDLTSLKRSHTRPHDHLVVEPQKINIQKYHLDYHMEFPKQHKYYSHLSHKDLFPQHKPPSKTVSVIPEEQDHAEDSDGEYDVEPVLAFDREFKPVLASSTKGCGWRREKLNDSWRPGPKPRPDEQKVSADAFNEHRKFARGLKETHYSRTHGYAIKALSSISTPNLLQYSPNYKHEILRNFNAKFCEKIPDIRKPMEKKHVFNGVNSMQIEHG